MGETPGDKLHQQACEVQEQKTLDFRQRYPPFMFCISLVHGCWHGLRLSERGGHE